MAIRYIGFIGFVCLSAFLSGCGHRLNISVTTQGEYEASPLLKVHLVKIDNSGMREQMKEIVTKCAAQSCQIEMRYRLPQAFQQHHFVVYAERDSTSGLLISDEAFVLTYGSTSMVKLVLERKMLNELTVVKNRAAQIIALTREVVVNSERKYFDYSTSEDSDVQGFFLDNRVVLLRLYVDNIFYYVIFSGDDIIGLYKAGKDEGPGSVNSHDRIYFLSNSRGERFAISSEGIVVSLPPYMNVIIEKAKNLRARVAGGGFQPSLNLKPGESFGRYVFAAGDNTLQDCVDGVVLWVTGKPALLSKLQQTYRQVRRVAGEKVFIRYQGVRRGKRSDDSPVRAEGFLELEDFSVISGPLMKKCSN